MIARALRGDRFDHTAGDLTESLILLAVPMVSEMIMESVFAVADVFWVSRLGPDAIATVGITETLMTIIYAMAMGTSMAATATVARRIGEKDPDGAARAAVQVIALGLLIAGVLGAIGAVFAPRLLSLMGASDAVVATGSGFTRVLLGGNASVFLLFLINAVFRGAGDAAIAMRTLWLANILNIALGPCFIFGLGPFPELGVTGAAVATTLGRSTGVAFQVWMLARAGGHLTLRRRHLRFEPKVMASIVRIGANGAAQMLIGTTSWIGLVRILSTFGSKALAGFTVGIRVIMFALLPPWGLANAAATMVGQNLGAKRPERAEQAAWAAARVNMVLLTGIGVAFVVLAGPIVGLFSSDPDVLASGTSCLRIGALGFPFYAYGMVLTASFNGAGDTWTPTLINCFCFWMWEIPIAWLLSGPAGLGATGVFCALAIAYSTVAAVAVVVFRRGKWKEKKV
ncbi:MAG TPA: MATE family efflux transporter [Haliangiales bacterium]|nr:MATE family efflux transporter [Haliangiales bacterium]